MKKTFFSALGLVVSASLVSAQGLYNLMPFDDEPSDSLPLNWTIGASIGYDDNPSAIGSDVSGVDSDGEAYASAFIQANFVNQDPQTTWDVWARLGLTYYFDEVKQTGPFGVSTTDDTFYNARGGVNLSHRFNERMRFRSRSDVAYETEPDFDYGYGTDRRTGEYVRYSTDNSFGYRWTERFGTVTGWRFYGVDFDDSDGSDYYTNLFYNEFRYRGSPQTVYTASYRYGISDTDDSSDSDSHYFLVGAEHQFSATTTGVVRLGGQYFDPDTGSDTWGPYVEGMIRSQINEQFSIRSFVRYGIEPQNRTIATALSGGGTPTAQGTYDDHSVLRIGAQGSYAISPRLTIFGGGNLIYEQYDDLVATTSGAPSDFDETTVNLNIGASMQMTDNIYLTGSYNFTTASSDATFREYDRNRVQLGVQATF